MNAEIITIGDEILIGQIVDTNSQWISKALNNIGISVYQITSIQDNKYHILKALKEAESNVDIIILTGGLGPTKDDITKTTLANYFNDTLVLNTKVLDHIEKLFEKYNRSTTELNRNQALLPSKCTALNNEYGTAAGMLFKHKGNMVFSLPGVPYEMKGLMKTEVLPILKKTYELPYLIHKTIITYGVGETTIAKKIEDLENNLPKEIKLAYLPSAGKVRLRLSAKGIDKNFLENSIAIQVKKMETLIGDIIVGYDDMETMETMVGKLLKEDQLTLSTVESCTGGAIAKRITSVPGASEYYLGSMVTYATQTKINILDVDPKIIDNHTAVSAEVTEQMAKKIQFKFNSDYAIATTGNAGPTKSNVAFDVGTVFISIATPTNIITENFNFGKPRNKVIERTVNKSLEMLRKEILKNR